MRIVAGTFGGRKLLVPTGRDIRPTSDKIRGAVMNMLRSRDAIDDAVVIDVFCGTGALGLEAISQGAASCLFIDQSRESLELAKENARALGVTAEFVLKDATKIGLRPESKPQASLVFIDPPYKKNLVLPALEALEQGGWMAQGAWVVVEVENNFDGAWPDFVAEEAQKNYGETKIYIFRKT